MGSKDIPEKIIVFRNEAERLRWVKWTHDGARVIARKRSEPTLSTAQVVALFADEMVLELRARES